MADIAELGFSVDSKPISNASKELGGLSNAAAKTESATQRMNREADKSVTALNGMDRAGNALIGTLGGVTAAMAVKALANAADTWSDLSSRVKIAVGEHEDVAAVMARLTDVARGTYSSLESTATAFAQNSVTLKALGKTTQEQLNYTEALNNALVVSGAKGHAAQMVQDGLSRAMAEGTLRGQELNLILNYGSRAAELLAQELGVNITELRGLASEGKITGDVIYNSLTKNLETLTKEAESMPATIGDAFLLMRNAVLENIGVYDQQNQVSEQLAEQLVDLSDAMRTVDFGLIADGAKILAAIIATKLVVSVGASGIAFTAAQVQAARYQVTLASMAGVSSTAAVGLGALSVAARAASAAMALVGGPVGAALLAASALYYFANSASQAEKDADELDSRIAKLGGSFAKMNANQAAAAMLLYSQKLADANEEMRAAEQEAANLQMKMSLLGGVEIPEQWNDEFILAQGAAADAADKIKEINDKLNELRGIVNRGDGAALAADTNTASEAFTKLNNQLREKLALTGLNSAAERLAAQAAGGFLEGVSAEEAKILVAIQQQIDARENAAKQAEDRAKAAISAADEIQRKEQARLDGINSEITGAERLKATYGMTEAQLKAYDLTQQGALGTQAKYVEGIYAEIAAKEAQKKTNADAKGIAESLRTEEEQIAASYAERKAIIMAAEFETEIERQALLMGLKTEHDTAMLEANGTYWEQWLLGAEESMMSFDELAGATMQTLYQGFGNAFESMVFDAKSAGDAVKGMAEGMARSVVNALGQMIAQEIAYVAVQKLKGTTATATSATQVAAISATTTASLAATATTTATSTTAAATTAAAWTPAAVIASIGSFGGAAAIGLAAVIAAMAFGGFKKGGYTGNGGTNEAAGVVHGKEFVFDAASTARIGVGNLEAMQAGRGLAVSGEVGSPKPSISGQQQAPDVNVTLNEDASKAGTVQRDDDGMISVFVANIMQEGEVYDAMAGKFGMQGVGS